MAAACQANPATHIGDKTGGRVIIIRQQCGSCHVIPGIPGADGLVGPSLAHFSKRATVAGILANTPANLVAWLRHPQSFVPGNAMPDSGLDEQQARDVAAYLYSIP